MIDVDAVGALRHVNAIPDSARSSCDSYQLHQRRDVFYALCCHIYGLIGRRTYFGSTDSKAVETPARAVAGSPVVTETTIIMSPRVEVARELASAATSMV